MAGECAKWVAEN